MILFGNYKNGSKFVGDLLSTVPLVLKTKSPLIWMEKLFELQCNLESSFLTKNMDKNYNKFFYPIALEAKKAEDLLEQ